MSKSKEYTSTIYKMICKIHNKENNNIDIEYDIKSYDVKVLNHGYGPFETPYDGEIYIENLNRILSIDKSLLIMWSLSPDIAKFKEKIIEFNINEAFNNINMGIYLSGYKPTISEYSDLQNYINKFIKKCKDKSEDKFDE